MTTEVEKVHSKYFRVGDGSVVVELGPQRFEAEASKALLAPGVTAPWYTVGRNDSMGKPIVLGEPGVFIDWLNTYLPSLWKVYQKDEQGVMQQKDEYLEVEDALELAVKLYEGAT